MHKMSLGLLTATSNILAGTCEERCVCVRVCEQSVKKLSLLLCFSVSMSLFTFITLTLTSALFSFLPPQQTQQ